jgi:hypothetical protein
MHRSSRHARGSTLLVVLILVTVLMGLVAGILMYAGKERSRAAASSRTTLRLSCAEGGLQLARSYFGRNFNRWNDFLAAPSQYDPLKSVTTNTPHNPNPANPNDPALRLNHPELFADLDGDNKPDVYLYIRDNEDEPSSALSDPSRDNDHNVVVGAICISETMKPRFDEGAGAPRLAHEGLLSYNGTRSTYRNAHEGDGTGNMN